MNPKVKEFIDVTKSKKSPFTTDTLNIGVSVVTIQYYSTLQAITDTSAKIP